MDTARRAEYAEIVRAYQAVLKHYIKSKGLQCADAEDVTQTVFLKLWVLMGMTHYETINTPRAWLIRVADRLMIDRSRSAGSKRKLIHRIDVEDFEDPSPDPLTQIVISESIGKVRGAVEKLQPVEREVIEHRLNGFTHSQIADLMGCSERTSNRRLARGLERLYADLAGQA